MTNEREHQTLTEEQHRALLERFGIITALDGYANMIVDPGAINAVFHALLVAALRVMKERENASDGFDILRGQMANETLQKEYWYHEWRWQALGSGKGAPYRAKADAIFKQMQTAGISPWSPKENE